MTSIRLAFLGLGLSVSVHAQTTHIVLGPNLQTAIFAAAPGDVLLVSGEYNAGLLRV